MGTFRKTAFWIRVSILLGALGATLLLYAWSQQADPRFYLFLASRPGRMLARVFHWQGIILPQEENKPESRMSGEERRIKRELEEEIQKTTPSARVSMKDGKVLTGQIREETADSVLFEENYGSSGALALRLRRDRIRELEELREPPPPITYRDILFKKEFPEYQLFKPAPYSILTDEKYFQVEGAVRELQKLHREFVETFQPVMAGPPAVRNIQVVFCSQEEMFRSYQRRYAPRMESSVGFYSPGTDRFLVFNQKNSLQMRTFSAKLEEQANHYKANEQQYGGAGRIDEWKKHAGQRMANVAEEQTRETIRHEGAHQLFFTYGVHSPWRMENEWLYEGLAVYCETPHIGEKSALRAALLKGAAAGDTLIPLPELVARRSVHGLFSFGAPEEVDLAYGESWALVHFLMQPERREDWFAYIRYVRDRSNFREVLRAPAYELLCRFIKMTPEELEKSWLEYIERM